MRFLYPRSVEGLETVGLQRIDEPNCRVISPDTVRETRQRARQHFEAAFAVWSGGDFALEAKAAARWWPDTDAV